MANVKTPRPAVPASIDEAQTALTVPEAARRVGVHEDTIRSAIKKGDLPAFLPMGKEPGKGGRGGGYRIMPAALERWYLGGKP